MMKSDLMQKQCLRENKDKRRKDMEKRRERRDMIGQQYILKKLCIESVVSMCSIYVI